MRIALHQTSDVGLRAGRIVLADPELVDLGLVGATPNGRDTRVRAVVDLSDYDVVMSDADDPGEIIQQALTQGIDCVVWRDVEPQSYDTAFAGAGQTLVAGSNLATGITPALAAHEKARTGEVLGVTTAWTEPGRPYRRGEPIPFPNPVGALWAKPRAAVRATAMVARTDGPWAAGLARVTSAVPSGVSTRVVGVADDAEHLEGIALAAGALAVARGGYTSGFRHPEAGAERYLIEALAAGLDVATYTLDRIG